MFLISGHLDTKKNMSLCMVSSIESAIAYRWDGGVRNVPLYQLVLFCACRSTI